MQRDEQQAQQSHGSDTPVVFERPWLNVAAALRERFGQAPAIAVVLGSGAGPVAARMQQASEPVLATQLGLPGSTTPGHAGTLQVGQLGGHPTLVVSGRVHAYEGRSLEEVVRTVRGLWAWGVREVVLTCAVGSTRTELVPGSLLRLRDHINLCGMNPLRGPHDPTLGPRFPDMSKAYDPDLGQALDGGLRHAGGPIGTGVFAWTGGPTYETPAEVRMAAMLGGDVVGMSTVPEVIAGVQVGLRMGAIAVVSNLGAGLSEQALLHSDVTEVVAAAAQRLGNAIEWAIAERASTRSN